MTGSLPFFTNRRKADRKLARDCATDDEAARLDPYDLVDARARIGMQNLIYRGAKAVRVGEKTGDIAKQDPFVREIHNDPFVREIHNGADVVLDRIHGGGRGV
ncbi:hypothetical protein P775_21950 [Puniceibacterium antarcticum]|uniref:Uncharacterized protein n=1 Tax=Puniceibacterium antarcticum TaxID=1206336 RepID=A0A2G8RAC8_9RHOB|nr:hypothetical protein P775_21950 [Puniceibacterium antarcticum]